MRRLARTAATALVVLGAGGGLAAAEDLLRAGATAPELVTDLEGPLFLLQGMAPGAPPVERCVTVVPRGGRADAVFVSGTVTGQLASRVHQEVTAGRAADGVRASRACEGFLGDRTLWRGPLSAFPSAAAALQDDAPLEPGEPRVYRFRAWIEGHEAPPLDQLAEQDLEWRAELDPVPPPPAISTDAPAAGVEVPGPGASAPAPAVPPVPPAPTCITDPGDRPIRVFLVAGRRVALLVGPVRRLRAGEPLSVRVRDPAGVVLSAAYELAGRPVRAAPGRPWGAQVPTSALTEAKNRLSVRVQTVRGAILLGHVDLHARACAPMVRAAALAPVPAGITVHLDLGFPVRHVGIAMPPGVAVARRGLTASSGPRRPLAVGRRNGRVVLGAVPGGTVVRLHVPVRAGARPALSSARCAGADLVLRVVPVTGEPRYLRTPLLGRGGECSG